MRLLRSIATNLALIIISLLLTAAVVAEAEEKISAMEAPKEENSTIDLPSELDNLTMAPQKKETLESRVDRYFHFVWNSFTGRRRDYALREVGFTLALLTLTMALVFVFGLYWGLRAGYRGGWSDRILSTLAPLFSGVPAWFWSLLFLWTLWWKWDIGSINYSSYIIEAKRHGGVTILTYLGALLIPVLALTLSNVVVYAFNVRNLVKRESNEDHFFADLLKGLPDRRIMKKLLRTVLPSFLTFTSYNFLNLMINAMAVEKLFDVPGIGWVLTQAVTVTYENNEFGIPTIPEFQFHGNEVFFVAFVMAFLYFINSTVLEALYLHLDPRREVHE
ncbi:peptide ABC transporter permease [Thermococcus profundus]|uniref:Peptide ABC transporter permease n=1 Tax=Thermococcus profundus TaxID=49899 RepID=A0A2Z2M8C1_THEPR|nr:ABC transporter permease [Thermococcus profundus]ASJ01916.1 peptide ABC transporter permease [Thermococcus profundus]